MARTIKLLLFGGFYSFLPKKRCCRELQLVLRWLPDSCGYSETIARNKSKQTREGTPLPTRDGTIALHENGIEDIRHF